MTSKPLLMHRLATSEAAAANRWYRDLDPRLADRGFAPGATADRPWGRTFVVRDPDGRRVEVKQA